MRNLHWTKHTECQTEYIITMNHLFLGRTVFFYLVNSYDLNVLQYRYKKLF